MKKQDTLDDGDGIEDAFTAGTGGGGGDIERGGTHQYSRSFSPSNLQLPTDFVSTQRLDRESSLEAISQPSGSVHCIPGCVHVHVHVYIHVLLD